MVWTLFWDMHSGGSTKVEPFEKIYIEAPEEVAKSVFQARFGHNPERVSCTCCGSDYSIKENRTLEEASAYHRDLIYVELPQPDNWDAMSLQERLEWYKKNSEVAHYIEPGEPIPSGLIDNRAQFNVTRNPKRLDEYLKQEDVLVIRSSEIKDEERR